MSMSKLQLCGTCQRRVPDDEVSCPICAAPMGKAPRRMITGPVLSRAALLVSSVAASFAGGEVADGIEASMADVRTSEAIMALSAYGIVIDDGSCERTRA